MKGFFDSFKGDGGDNNNNNKKKKGGSGNSLLGGLGFNQQQQPNRFHGGGQSLGGTHPGVVIPVQLSDAGPIGLKVEKRSTGTAIVATVVANSQAERAGLRRGDVVCFAGTDGQSEVPYDVFVQQAKSSERPICFEVRRIDGDNSGNSKKKQQPQQPPKSSSATNAAVAKDTDRVSAEAYARKQAMIAAAEAREKAHKKKTKGISKKAPPPPKQQQQQDSTGNDDGSSSQQQQQVLLSEASKAAVEAAKRGEAETAAALGYNPYETNKVSAGQARNATVASAHGTIDASTTSGRQQQPQQPQQRPPGEVRPPRDPTAAEGGSDGDAAAAKTSIDPQFTHAFERLVTCNDDASAVKSGLAILRKLVVNATTKSDDKFRRVRLANPKIKAAAVDLDGALDLLMATGFQITEDAETGESVLVYVVPVQDVPSWIAAAIEQMKAYEEST